jgi:haloacetate dehalogenase
MMNQREFHDLPGLLAAPIPRRRAITLVAGSLLGGTLGLRPRSANAAAHGRTPIFDSSINNSQGGRSGRVLFDGLTRTCVTTSGAEINVVYGGSGPPVLLLHGSPQTHAMWHAVAPRLAEHHTVVAADLRSYGDSSKPPGGGDHADYSFRAMAADQLEVMRSLGHERFALVGHDRGARVAHRLALDHPDAVERMAVLDIVPTSYVYGHADRRLATLYFHWFFLIQPEPLPERLIGGDPLFFVRRILSFSGGLDAYAPEALAEYERCFVEPATIRGLCEDYRAAASIDLEHDEVDRDRRIECPLLLLWGARSAVGALYQPLEVWRSFATDVRGRALDAGHFLAEERPRETLAELEPFLAC